MMKEGPIEMIIFQSTAFCNLDCHYCYLPHRMTKGVASIKVFRRCMENIFSSNLIASNVILSWHAGEPLTAPLEFYEETSDIVDSLTGNGQYITQNMQTNGVLINDQWCDFFNRRGYNIGLSLDGPDYIHDANRVTRLGKKTHEKTMKGLRFLQKHNVPFSIICVITENSLGHAKEMYDFFSENGVGRVGFNVEETEGINISRIAKSDSFIKGYRDFMLEMYELQKDKTLDIREFSQIKDRIIGTNNELCCEGVIERHKGGSRYSSGASILEPLQMLSIGMNGDFFTFSPELLGHEFKDGRKFYMGNLFESDIKDTLKNPVYLDVSESILAGRKACKASCDYYNLCLGGAPSNKFFENKDFNSTETFYCRTKLMIPIDIVLDDLESTLNN